MGLYELLRACIYAWRAMRWKAIEAKFTRVTADKPAGYYSFTVNGIEYGGIFTCLSGEMDEAGHLTVRYNPRNPARNAILNGDNRQLPFRVYP